MSLSTRETVDLTTLAYSLVNKDEASEVAALINQSFQKDAFFKKPEYVDRSSPEKMTEIATSGFDTKDTFLVGRVYDTVLEKIVPIAAINLTWKETIEIETCITSIVAEFGCVSVWPHFEKLGLGKANVTAAECFIKQLFYSKNGLLHDNDEFGILHIDITTKINSPIWKQKCVIDKIVDTNVNIEIESKIDIETKTDVDVDVTNSTPLSPTTAITDISPLYNKCIMEMIVLNVRTELIPWYQRQQYTIIREDIPFPADYTYMVADNYTIICTLMRKILV